MLGHKLVLFANCTEHVQCRELKLELTSAFDVTQGTRQRKEGKIKGKV